MLCIVGVGKGGENAPDVDASDGLLVLVLAYEKALNPPGLVPAVDADAADMDAAEGESAPNGRLAARDALLTSGVAAGGLGSECTSRSAWDALLLLPLRIVSRLLLSARPGADGLGVLLPECGRSIEGGGSLSGRSCNWWWLE